MVHKVRQITVGFCLAKPLNMGDVRKGLAVLKSAICLLLLSFFSSLSHPFFLHLIGGQRNWVQVFCNGGVACVAALCYVLWGGGFGELPIVISYSSPPALHTLAAMACLAAISCSCGDTWASEVGSVQGGTPRLLTSWKKVPRGTNGGVTLIGTVCSLMGGMAVGGAYYIGLCTLVGFESFEDAKSQSLVVLVGGVAGLVGSLVDSILGATVQYSGFSERQRCVVHRPGGNEGPQDIKHICGLDVLDNHAVNFVSGAITAAVLPLALWCTCAIAQWYYVGQTVQ